MFKKTLGHTERNYVSELRDARNKWAHQEPFTTQAAYRLLDSIQLLLAAVSATEQADDVERQKMDLLRISFDEQARNVTRRKTGPLAGGSTPLGLSPWRDVVTPHPDVASGNYQVAGLPLIFRRSIEVLPVANILIQALSSGELI